MEKKHLGFMTKVRNSLLFLHFIMTLAMVWGLSVAALAQDGGDSASQLHAVMPEKYGQFFQTYCYDCHDASTQEGSVNLEAIDFTVSSDIQTAQRWAKVLNAINSGEMPPEQSDPIEDDDKLEFLDALSQQVVLARRILSDSGGVITLRRLNRREYQNTMEQLTGIRPDISTLPDDQATSGFDTSGASLFFSSDQLEAYLALARSSLELSFFPPPQRRPRTIRIEPEDKYTAHYTKVVQRMRETLDRAKAWKAQKNKRPPEAFGFLDEYQVKKRLSNYPKWLPQLEQYLAAPENRTGATLILTIKEGGYTRINFPVLKPYQVGRYKIRLRAAALEGAAERFQYVEFSSGFSGENKHLGWRKVIGTLENPEIVTFSFDHLPGQTNAIKITQRTHQDRGDKNLWTLHQSQNGIGTAAGVWIDWAELEGPFPLDRADAGNEILFKWPAKWSDTKYVAEILERFTHRAFRGKTPPRQYLAKLFDRYLEGRKRGLNLERALIDPLAIVLASPSFLYMVETKEATGDRLLSEMELAVRLAQFLWSEMPDSELIALAEAGDLSDAGVLKRQVDRLLSDPKSNRFLEGFVHQWLQMERLEMFQFNGLQYPTFDNAIRANARQEVYQTIRATLDQGWPLKTLLKSDIVVVNDVMAGYYGIKGVHGHEFRKVDLPNDSPRGGLMSTAAVLAMGSDGVRTSPVERGAWVLRHLVNRPPPPAPPNVPQLSRLDGEPLSGRALQAAHQEQPQCAQCHRKIDPIGFAMENFDAAGLWRESEMVVVKQTRRFEGQEKRVAPNAKVNARDKTSNGKTKQSRKKNGRRKTTKHTFAIDSSGELPNGQSFQDFKELRDLVAEHEDDFARGLTESLVAYGLGRPFAFTDEDLANSILEKSKPKDYQIAELIHALVQSTAFRSK